MRLLIAWVQEMVTKPTRPEGVWPVTISGWVGLILGVGSFAGWIVALRKANNQPILDEMARLENKFEDKIEFERRDLLTKLNGLGRRVTEDRNDLNRVEEAVAEQANRQVRSEEDRRQLNNRQSTVESRLDALGPMIQSIERGLREKIETQGKEQMNALSAQTERLMRAIFETRGHQ